MENNSINPSEVATLSLLGGGGYGYGGRGYQNGQFADDATNAVRIQSSDRASMASHVSLSRQISDNADRNRDISRTQQEDGHFNGVIDKIADQSRFFTAELNAIGRERAADARIAAECCCAAKLLAVTNQAKTDAGLATLLANQECATKVADAVANATQNAKLDILLSERSRGHGGNG